MPWNLNKKYDPHQITKVPKNAPVTHEFLAKIKHLILNSLIGGDGVLVERMGENVIIRLRAQPRGGSGGRGMYTATTKAGLPSGVGETSMGRVTAGGDQGMMCIRNPDNDGWDAINVCE